jgi:GTPase SAR1 family protein
MQYRINKFNPLTSKHNAVWLIIGPRNTGKTVLVKDLLHATHTRYDVSIGMTMTKQSADDMRDFMPPIFVYDNGYDYSAADRFLNTCKVLCDRGKVRSALFNMDDCMYDNKVMKTLTQKNLHLNGRHFNTTVFNTTQYCMIIPSDIRTNVDYVIVLRDSILANKRRLYEYFFGMFPSLAEFNKVFDSCTQNYGAMVLDKTSPSTALEDCVKWYRSSPNTPPFKIGKSIFYKFSDRLIQYKKSLKYKKSNQHVLNV